ncbi:MAG: hypothetical protein GVY04_17785 [Cyanobacteria bacterium]|jgi:hypothetical protein|nr:hypothetical protein [Cyanobacteria bacterium GSL.Bin1]
MSRNKKYYFARLHVDYNKNYYGNDKENFIYRTLTEPSNIESSFTHHLVKTYWTFSNIGTLEWENGSKVYMITLFLEEVDASTQRTYLFIIFAFLFSWGLLASLSIGLTTLRYALTRAKYVEISNGSKSNEEHPYISDNN